MKNQKLIGRPVCRRLRRLWYWCPTVYTSRVLFIRTQHTFDTAKHDVQPFDTLAGGMGHIGVCENSDSQLRHWLGYSE